MADAGDPRRGGGVRGRRGRGIGLVRGGAPTRDGDARAVGGVRGPRRGGLAGNAVENVVGIQQAMRNRTDLAISLIQNSSLQVAIALTPVLVLVSLVSRRCR